MNSYSVILYHFWTYSDIYNDLKRNRKRVNYIFYKRKPYPTGRCNSMRFWRYQRHSVQIWCLITSTCQWCCQNAQTNILRYQGYATQFWCLITTPPKRLSPEKAIDEKRWENKPLWSANSDLDFSWNLWFMFKPKCGLVQYRQIDLEFWDQIGAHSSFGPRLEVVGMSTCPIFVMKFFLSPSCLYSITTFLSSLYPFCPPLPSVSSSPCFPVGYVVIMFYIVLQPCMYMYLWNKVKI
jgi:hypothetical protein